MCRGRRRAGGGLSTDARKADDIASSPQQELKNWIVEDLAHAYSLPWSPSKSGRTALDIKQQPWQKEFFIEELMPSIGLVSGSFCDLS